jgi:hypothetical protein
VSLFKEKNGTAAIFRTQTSGGSLVEASGLTVSLNIRYH